MYHVVYGALSVVALLLDCSSWPLMVMVMLTLTPSCGTTVAVDVASFVRQHSCHRC